MHTPLHFHTHLPVDLTPAYPILLDVQLFVQINCMSTLENTIEVVATSVYIEQQSEPDNGRYFFAYQVVIRNVGDITAQLKTRHWIITDSNGKVQEVRGDGVVGEQPRLEPGEHFTYTSAAIIETPVGSMHGSYQMVSDEGEEFDAVIPPFSLSMPNVVH